MIPSSVLVVNECATSYICVNYETNTLALTQSYAHYSLGKQMSVEALF